MFFPGELMLLSPLQARTSTVWHSSEAPSPLVYCQDGGTWEESVAFLLGLYIYFECRIMIRLCTLPLLSVQWHSNPLFPRLLLTHLASPLCLAALIPGCPLAPPCTVSLPWYKICRGPSLAPHHLLECLSFRVPSLCSSPPLPCAFKSQLSLNSVEVQDSLDSSPQTFWHQGLVLWKTVLPQTRWGDSFRMIQ